MIWQGRQLLWGVGLLAAMGVSLCAGQFSPPAEGPVAFRRDRIPLDVDGMVGLSQHLESLARGWNATTAIERRGAAQMLALAMALDPANTNARQLVVEYEKDRHRPQADAGRLETIRARILPVVVWLETAAAGSHGQALAACLKDILTLSDPKRPEADEKGLWAGWIPSLSVYEAPVVVKNDESRIPRIRVVPPVPKSDILLSKAEVHTLLWRKSGTKEPVNWVLAPAPLQMVATKVDENQMGRIPFHVVIGAGQGGLPLAQTSASLCKLLLKTQESLPSGYRISINSKELEQSLLSHKLQSVSAAAAVLANSAVTGCEPEAIIIGQIDENGTFSLPTGFWNQLLALGKGNGQRLVLPADAAAFLGSLLAMEKPGFFLEYEVLLAANFKQLLDMTAKVPDSALAKTSEKFRGICAKAGNQDVRQYIANRFVRQRLGEILQEVPSHYSAKMLLIQAAGTRPTLVTRAVLAAELRRAIEPMDWIVRTAGLVNAPWSANTGNGTASNKSGVYEFSASDIAKCGPTNDLCRARVDGLERHVEKNDRELLERARKTIGAIRLIERASRTRGYSYVVTEAMRSACGELLSIHKEFSDILAREEGDVPASSHR